MRRKSFSKHRSSLPRKAGKKYFSKNAVRVHPMNLRAVPMRGGFRL